jgi:hypothetical protein
VYEVAISRRVAYVAPTAGDPYAPVPALKRAADGVNAHMVMFGGQSMEDIIEGSLGRGVSHARCSPHSPGSPSSWRPLGSMA